MPSKESIVVRDRVVEQVIVENTELNSKVSAKNILAWSVEGKEGRFAVFNLNTPDVCGALGCLYTGYWLRKDKPITQVFLSYLNPNLPLGKHLLSVGENRGQALPCIKVLQTEQEQLRQLNFCFNGTGYNLLIVSFSLIVKTLKVDNLKSRRKLCHSHLSYCRVFSCDILSLTL